jgi:hypothetical protein
LNAWAVVDPSGKQPGHTVTFQREPKLNRKNQREPQVNRKNQAMHPRHLMCVVSGDYQESLWQAPQMSHWDDCCMELPTAMQRYMQSRQKRRENGKCAVWQMKRDAHRT